MSPDCPFCRQPMALLFNGYYCKNHCDLPADKKAAAQKKDQEVKARANSQSHQAGSGVAAPVSTPVERCPRCGNPRRTRVSFISGWTTCDNLADFGLGLTPCNYVYPAPDTQSTFNFGNVSIPVVTNTGLPTNHGWIVPLAASLYEERGNLRRYGMVSEQ